VYTLWGFSKVTAVNVSPKRPLSGHEISYDYWLNFAPFQPLSEQKWVKNLTDINLTGEEWRQGGFRYLSEKKEHELLARIDGTYSTSEIPEIAIKSEKESVLALPIPNLLLKKLKDAAQTDGRSIEDISRQAIAEWLKKSF